MQQAPGARSAHPWFSQPASSRVLVSGAPGLRGRMCLIGAGERGEGTVVAEGVYRLPHFQTVCAVPSLPRAFQTAGVNGRQGGTSLEDTWRVFTPLQLERLMSS